MKKVSSLVLLMICVAVSACHKKTEEASASAAASAPASASVAATPAPVVSSAPVELTPEQEAMQKKKSLLEYGMMEDQYLNDAKGQWAASAKASSTFGDDRNNVSSVNQGSNVTGAPDGKTWSNNQQDMGFDWLELSYAKPTNITEVRAVFLGKHATESISKLELQDTDGKWNTVWSGISEQKEDRRGERTWFVKKFEKTAYKVKAVKLTFANNLSHGYKEVEAVQIVGE